MRILLISFLAIPFLAISTPFKLLAKDINCNSPVWKNRKPCKDNNIKKGKFSYGSWFPFGFNKKGTAVNWAQLLSYKELNKNSFSCARSRFRIQCYAGFPSGIIR